MIAKWDEQRSHLPPHGISYKPGGSKGQHGVKARDKRGPLTDDMRKEKARMIAVAKSVCKRKVNVIRAGVEETAKKIQKQEKLLPKPEGHVDMEIGNDCTWGVLYLILRGFVNRSLTPVKGRSLTPLRHRAHGPLSHFESNSCTGPMSRILNPFMCRSLNLSSWVGFPVYFSWFLATFRVGVWHSLMGRVSFRTHRTPRAIVLRLVLSEWASSSVQTAVTSRSWSAKQGMRSIFTLSVDTSSETTTLPFVGRLILWTPGR